MLGAIRPGTGTRRWPASDLGGPDREPPPGSSVSCRSTRTTVTAWPMSLRRSGQLAPAEAAERCQEHERGVPPVDRLGQCEYPGEVSTGRPGDFSTLAPLMRHGLRMIPSSSAVLKMAWAAGMPLRP